MAGSVYSLANKRVWVAGHRGMVGQALMRRLTKEGCHIMTVGSDRVDLRRQQDTEDCLGAMRPDAIFLAAARVGGIQANDSYPATFLYDNLMIASNVMEAARKADVEKLMFLGSSCIYPKHAPQPIPEDALLSGPLEPTNEAYALAKIAGLKMAQAYRRQYGIDFISVQPSNLYGPGDNFHPEHSHVPAALLRRFHEAKESQAPTVVVWGSGRPRREFLYVDDLADACVYLMKEYSGHDPVNVGTGQDITIAEFGEAVARTVGYRGDIVYDNSKPDGTPRKVLDITKLTRLGWHFRTPLKEGLELFYRAFLAAEARAGARAVAVVR